MTIAAVSVSYQEERTLRAYYAEYEKANAFYDEDDYQSAAQIYRTLTEVFPKSYILEYKLAVCIANLDDFPETIRHAKRALALNPMLIEDSSFMDFLIYCFDVVGDQEAIEQIRNHESGVQKG